MSDDTDQTDSSSSLARLLQFVRSAGAGEESETDRNGFLSYHAESHAVGVGAGLGFSYGATGDKQYAGLLLSAAVAGLRGHRDGAKSRVLNDVRQEPHYALGGFVLGALAGAVVSGRPLDLGVVPGV